MMSSSAYVVHPLIGADGAGKSTLMQGLASAAGSYARPVNVDGFSAHVVDVQGASAVHQFVDFADAMTERSLFPSSRATGAILVVSALDSVLPGTRDSLVQAQQCGIAIAAVALTKFDQVEDVELADLVTMEIRELVNKYGSNGDLVPVVLCGLAMERRRGEEQDPTQGPRRLLAAIMR
jgi:translation elongation factor EF-Tu-like GTPase